MEALSSSRQKSNKEIGRLLLEKVPPVVTLLGALVILTTFIPLSVRRVQQPIFLLAISLIFAVFIGFRAIESLGVSKRLHERWYSRELSAVLAAMSLVVSILWLADYNSSIRSGILREIQIGRAHV